MKIYLLEIMYDTVIKWVFLKDTNTFEKMKSELIKYCDNQLETLKLFDSSAYTTADDLQGYTTRRIRMYTNFKRSIQKSKRIECLSGIKLDGMYEVVITEHEVI